LGIVAVLAGPEKNAKIIVRIVMLNKRLCVPGTLFIDFPYEKHNRSDSEWRIRKQATIPRRARHGRVFVKRRKQTKTGVDRRIRFCRSAYAPHITGIQRGMQI
jgi:hypothetical protein